ncbi:Zinc finger protein [Pseudolycoriella hygida]|uniref:Zinc finger protein 593 homolog n=1 Tax=Pseudolycoriella hygida TaxID=35572 RepID=A0A9Q0MQD2_9DIPT|nr:Zinc finger protein [Pseudolycoriella hygida]
MGKPQRRKKMHFGDTHLQRRWRTRNRNRDLDLIDEDLQTKSEQLIHQNVDLEKPGFAQFYCIHCAKYFIDDHSIQAHYKTKVHKRRMKALELEPYTIEESERAAGHGSFKQPLRRKIETQPSKEEFASGKRVTLEVVSSKEENAMES